MYCCGLHGILTGLVWGITSTLRMVTAAGAPTHSGVSALVGPEALNLTLAGLDQSGHGGGQSLSSTRSTPAGVEAG